ncbi:MAG TPA: methyltransferase domain-containing protein [Thermoplasmata archaeon]|nr:methyltransferase domain-containing protein [Thermoplasmata archaeon]
MHWGPRGRFAEDVARVQARYRWLARVYPAFEVILGVPPGARTLAVRRLALRTGDRVLEVGCGTGSNLERLRSAVGAGGRVYGVDVTREMLERARRRRDHGGWSNVELVEGDAAGWRAPEPVDGILLCFCYSVLPDPRGVLSHVWRFLRTGGRVVVLDGAIRAGFGGRFLGRAGSAVSRATVLGDAARRPWEDLRAFTREVFREVLPGGIYVVSSAVKNE